MKRLCLYFALCFSLSSAAQDVIVFNDYSTQIVRVLTIDNDEISYKKWDNLDGPIYRTSLDRISAINYSNGTKDVFKNKDGALSEAISNNPLVQDSEENHSFIERYNSAQANHFKPIAPHFSEQAKSCSALFSIDSSSRMISSDISIGIYSHVYLINGYEPVVLNACLGFRNLTNQTIYIDLGNTFRVVGPYPILTHCYYDSSVSLQSQSEGSGIGLSLGSVANILGVGGTIGTLAQGTSVSQNKGSQSTKVIKQDRIIAIPPHAEYYTEFSDESSWFNPYLYDKCTDLKVGEIRELPIEETFSTVSFFSVYSTAQDFSTYKAVSLKYYLSHLVGMPKKGVANNLQIEEYNAEYFKGYENDELRTVKLPRLMQYDFKL